MDPLSSFVDFVLHIDKHLNLIIQQYGVWTYIILFLIIFCETGLVFTPFFPGDSLLFAAGAFAALGSLDVWILFATLAVAAVLGDTANYWIGYLFGKKMFKKHSRILKTEYLERAERFYEKHGGKTIFLARFVPIIRTFAPFVAGIGKMRYLKFLAYNVLGGITWVALFTFAGYYFGSISFVQENFTLFIFVIIAASFVPVAFEYLKHRK